MVHWLKFFFFLLINSAALSFNFTAIWFPEPNSYIRIFVAVLLNRGFRNMIMGLSSSCQWGLLTLLLVNAPTVLLLVLQDWNLSRNGCLNVLLVALQMKGRWCTVCAVQISLKPRVCRGLSGLYRLEKVIDPKIGFRKCIQAILLRLCIRISPNVCVFPPSMSCFCAVPATLNHFLGKKGKVVSKLKVLACLLSFKHQSPAYEDKVFWDKGWARLFLCCNKVVLCRNVWRITAFFFPFFFLSPCKSFSPSLFF